MHHVETVLKQHGLQLRIAEDLSLILRILQVLRVNPLSLHYVRFDVLPHLLRVLIITSPLSPHCCPTAHVRPHEVAERLVHVELLRVSVPFRWRFRPRLLRPLRLLCRLLLLLAVNLHRHAVRQVRNDSLLHIISHRHLHHHFQNANLILPEHLLHLLVVVDNLLVAGVLKVVLVNVLPHRTQHVILRVVVAAHHRLQLGGERVHLA